MLFIDFQAIKRVVYILCICNMQYWTKQKIALSYKVVSCMIKMRLIFGASKIFLFSHSLPFMVLTKSGANFGHFAGMIDEKMKLRGILQPKRPYFLSYFTAMPILNKL